jgi:tetratricopeptide (TPR) repeat protein
MYRALIRGFYLAAGILLCLVALVALVAGSLPALAEAPLVTAVGEYTMGEGETPAIAKERALMNAIRAAAEQTVIYVQSYSKEHNFALTKDEVAVLARAVVEVTDKHYEELKSASGEVCFRVTITAKVSSDSLNALRDRMQDKLAAAEMKKLQESYGESLREMEKLKGQLAKATGADRRDIEKSITANEQRFTAAQWFGRGYDLLGKQEYQAAIEAFSAAVALDPRCSLAYTNRGIAHDMLKQHEAAFADYNKAIEIDPGDACTYYNRGNLFYDLMQYTLAIADFTKAIAIAPDYAHAYNNRGMVYYNLKQYQQAIADFDKDVALDPQDALGFFNRGLAYSAVQQDDQAIADFSKAISLNPRDAEAYDNRGYAFFDLGRYEQSIADFGKVIEITPWEASAYYNKGMALSMLGRNQEAIEVLRTCLKFCDDDYRRDQVKDYIRKLGGQP